MTDNDIQSPSPTPIDPRLKSFLRQATAIITAEKGLNTASRIKLESLAKHLKLPPKLFEQALVLLQSNDTNLTHYEKAFVKFLDAELGRIKGGVISLGMELEAIDLAQRKYQINSTRAEQLIQARSQAVGISRISPDEAAQFAERIIVERVNQRPTVDDELREDLYRIGKKWGYQREQVDRVIFRQISQNRALQRTALLKRVAVVSGLLLFATAVGTAFATGQFSKLLSKANPTLPALDQEPTRESDEFGERESTLSQLQHLAHKQASLKPIVMKLGSPDAAQRKTAFKKLTDKTCSDQRYGSTELFELVSKLYFEEQSDEAASGVLASVRDKLRIQPLTDGISLNKLKDNYRANRMLGELCFSQTVLNYRSTTRMKNARAVIEELVKIATRENLTHNDYLQESNAAIAVDHWGLLNQTIWSPSSVETAVLYDAILDLTKPKLDLDTLNSYRDETLISLIEVDASDWRYLEEPIRETLSRCDPTKLNRWISVFVKSDLSAFQDFLSSLLLKRIDVKPRSVTREDVYAAISDYEKTIRDQPIKPVTSRDSMLSKSLAKFLAERPSNENDITPDLIANTALRVNLQMAFCAALENTTHLDDSSFVLVDRLSQTASSGRLRLRELISLSIDRRDKKPDEKSATASDRARKKSAITRLSQRGPGSIGIRKVALNQLADVATRFERISYDQAKTLAQYVLSDLGAEELQNIQLKIESFAHWDNLPLAIADQLPQSNVGLDQALTIARLLLGQDVEIEPQDSNWKRTLQSHLLVATASQVSQEVELDPNNLTNDWSRLQIYLSETYRDRLIIAGQTDFSGQSFLRPDQLLLELAIARSQNNQALFSRFENSNPIVEQASENDITKAILAGQFLVLVAYDEFRRTDFESKSSRLISEYQSAMRKQSFVGQQLYQTELVLLRMFALKRELLVRRLRERSQ